MMAIPDVVSLGQIRETALDALRRAATERLNEPVELDYRGNLTGREWLRLAMHFGHATGWTWDLHRPNIEWDPRKPPIYGDMDSVIFRGPELEVPHALRWRPDSRELTLDGSAGRGCAGCRVCGVPRPDLEAFERAEYERLRAKFGG